MLSSVNRPAPTPAAPAVPALSAAPRRYAGRQRRVLVVDDDPAHRTLMRDILEPLGIEVAEASDGPACLALWDPAGASAAPDLVLLDIAMPGMSGWTVAERLRALAPGLRIAMMSANVHEISPTRGIDARHDAIIAKPFDLRDFLDQVTRLLGLDWVEGTPPVAKAAEAGPGAPRVPAPSSAPRAKEGAPHPVTAARGGLPLPVLEELLRLGRIGHVRAIEARLAEIADAEPAAAAFAERLRTLVVAFDLPTYMRVLKDAAGEQPVREATDA